MPKGHFRWDAAGVFQMFCLCPRGKDHKDEPLTPPEEEKE